MRFARKCIRSKSSLVSYSLETAFSRQENHFLTACANGYFQEESRRETGGRVRFRVNTTVRRDCWSSVADFADEAFKLADYLLSRLSCCKLRQSFRGHGTFSALSSGVKGQREDGKDRAKE